MIFDPFKTILPRCPLDPRPIVSGEFAATDFVVPRDELPACGVTVSVADGVAVESGVFAGAAGGALEPVAVASGVAGTFG